MWLLIVVSFAAALYWTHALYTYMTVEVPDYGGVYREGAVGQPLYVNPALAAASETDADITRLVYSAPLRSDKDGGVQADLAEDWDVSLDGLVYTVHLRRGALWHDGEEVRADDVVFTYGLIQNPAYNSPIRHNWLGVEMAQIDDYTVSFTLKKPYFAFVNNLTTGILPKHIWENISPESFALSKYNIEPIGSGPYRFDAAARDAEENILVYEMKAFTKFYRKEPYISRFSIYFYPDADAAAEAMKRKEIQGLSSLDAQKVPALVEAAMRSEIHRASIPHYFIVFFNQTKSAALAYDEVREALSLATDRGAIIDRVFSGWASAISAPFLPPIGQSDPIAPPDKGKAVEILEENGWKAGEDGVRSKNGTRLEIDIITADWPEFSLSADMLRDQWAEIGVRASVKVVSVYDLGQNFVRTREYDALLFAHATGVEPDLYPYWHSGQKRDPGLNLSVFSSDAMDTALERSREVLGNDERKVYYEEIRKIITEKRPALYLFSPDYLYATDRRVRGISAVRLSAAADRFFDVDEWFVETKRILKKQ